MPSPCLSSSRIFLVTFKSHACNERGGSRRAKRSAGKRRNAYVPRDVAKIFQRGGGGGGSHCVKVSPDYHGVFATCRTIFAFKRLTKVGGGVGFTGTPGPPSYALGSPNSSLLASY